MGLDMYVYCNSKRICKEMNDSDEWGQYKAKNGIAIQWRKANAIHRWFVDNVQAEQDNCAVYEVDLQDLRKLRDTCQKVLDSTKLVDARIANGQTFKDGKLVENMVDGKKLEDPTMAQELLPTTEGFFFGSTDYDQWYWADLEYTVRAIDRMLEHVVESREYSWRVIHEDEPDWYVKFYYTSSW